MKANTLISSYKAALILIHCISVRRAAYILVKVDNENTNEEVLSRGIWGGGECPAQPLGAAGPCNAKHEITTKTDLGDIKSLYRCKPTKEGADVKGCRTGNYMDIKVNEDAVMWINGMWAAYCEPKQEVCRCKSLLGAALKANPSVKAIRGNFDAVPAIAGCKCYLGEAAKAGFKYVQLNNPKKEECTGRSLIGNGKDGKYVKLCETWLKQNCAPEGEQNWGTITR